MEVSLLHVMFNFFPTEVPFVESMSTIIGVAFISRYCAMEIVSDSFKQTPQLSRFGHETHNFSIGFTTACSSHDFY